MTVATCCHCKFSWEYTGEEKTCPNCGEAPGAPGKGGSRNKNHHAGKRTIGGETRHFPNRWEANYYRYLHWLESRKEIITFWYQPDYYEFPVQHGTTRYRPDFHVRTQDPDSDYFIEYLVEIKGWMDAASKTKLNRMKKYHPEIEVRVVTWPDMQALSKQVGGIIEGWER